MGDLTLIVVSLAGLILSFYAYFVTNRVGKNPDYRARCDISDKVSCTAVFKSKQGKTLGISNSVLGIVFYLSVFFSFLFDFMNLGKVVVLMGALFSVYFLYQLFFRVKISCVVCISVHVLNFLLVYLVFF